MTTTNTTETVQMLLQRALAHHQTGNLNEAQVLYAQILALDPNNVDALYLDGLVAHQRGQYRQALQRLEQALQINPAVVAIHTALGNTYRDHGQTEQALACYQTALKLDPANADAHYNLGIARHESGDLIGAVAAYRSAIAGNPAHPESWSNLGVALKAQGKADEAAACYAKAIELQPQHTTALFNLGVLHADAMRFDEAISYYRRALDAQPTYAAAAFNLGVAYKCLGAMEEAVHWFSHTLTLQEQHAGAQQNLGAMHYELGRFDVAEACYQRILALAPDNADVNYSLGLVALARGDYQRGWRAYEWRWYGAENCRQNRRDFAQPLWCGEDIGGQTILLHAEQGLGDTLQFVRYAPLVAQKGARVILECPPPLVRLLKSVAGIDLIVCKGDILPSFDWHCPLLSLPLAFGTQLGTVPADVPYLAPHALHVQRWKERLGQVKGIKVGVVWAGNPRRFSMHLCQIDRRRSLRLQQLTALAQVAGISFISLQLGEAASEASDPQPGGLRLLDFTTELDDFEDTAALVANLDLVISVDTSVSHLAGALGKPVWLLSRYDACWRWMREREDSPWYPAMRIFRQPRPGDWTSVIERVAVELTKMPGTAV